MFVVGSMSQPRKIDVYDATSGKGFDLRGDQLASVCSIVKAHTARNVVVGGNSSGRVFVFADDWEGQTNARANAPQAADENALYTQLNAMIKTQLLMQHEALVKRSQLLPKLRFECVCVNTSHNWLICKRTKSLIIRTGNCFLTRETVARQQNRACKWPESQIRLFV